MPAARDRLDARLDDDGSRSPDDTEIAFLLFTQTGRRSFQERIATGNADRSDVSK